MGVDEQIGVEVVYALPGEQRIHRLRIAHGATVREAIEQSGILERHPEIVLGNNQVGVFGQIRALDDELADGDRVEIYRPLSADPKEARRRRAARAGGSGRTG